MYGARGTSTIGDMATMTVPAPSPLDAAGLTMTMLADEAATGGHYAMADVEGERGAAVPRHVHDREDEWLLVLDGELLLRLDGEQRRVGPAEPAILPRNVPHAYEVTSDYARVLVLWDPAGFEEVLRVLVDAEPGAPPLPYDDVAALLAGAGVTMLEP
jgi:quercetin dioxygenase-like cupin family protein